MTIPDCPHCDSRATLQLIEPSRTQPTHVRVYVCSSCSKTTRIVEAAADGPPAR